MSQISRGLENVYIKTTSLTYIDGENGILRYGGTTLMTWWITQPSKK
jgi:citrate synthase (EC 2.3.3.1)